MEVVPSKEEALIFAREVKNKLSHREKDYEELLWALHDFDIRKISSASAVSKVQSLLAEEPDLIIRFNAFIPNTLSCPNNAQQIQKGIHNTDTGEVQETGVQETELLVQETDLGVPENDMGVQKTDLGVQETDMGVPETALYDQKTTLEKKLHQVSKKITKNDLLRGVEFVNRIQRRLKKRPKKMRKFCALMIKKGNTHDTEFLKSNLSVLFKNYPELLIEFSQFCWADDSEAEKPEENGTKKIDDYDDAMFEVDMLLAWMISAKEATERLFQAFQKNPTQTIEVDTYLTSMNLRTIERLYGNGTGASMLELLHQSPGLVLSIILPRLSQKLEEIIEEKVEIRSKVMQFHMGR